MREYKRLTKEYQYNCNLCKDRQCTTDKFCIDRVDCNLYNRLAELEDKIERGELFSIPFMYHSRKLNAYTVVYEDDDCEYLMGQAFRGKNAKEEAEKFLEQKLKELFEVQNER